MYLDYRIDKRPGRFRCLQEKLWLARLSSLRGRDLGLVRSGLTRAFAAWNARNLCTIYRNGYQARQRAAAFDSWRAHWRKASR
jgi:hypothetical protein